MPRKNMIEPAFISALRKLQLLRLEQSRLRTLESLRWSEAEQAALRFGRTPGEVYCLTTLIGAATTERVLLLGAEWHCAAVLDAFALYRAMCRAQGEADPVAYALG